MEIYTDDSEAALVLGKDWEFVWTDGERTQDTDSKFPLANEKFYIRLNYRENATKITNIIKIIIAIKSLCFSINSILSISLKL